MIVVLDTNVIISALLSPSGPPGEIIRYWEDSKISVATSDSLLDELESVLRYSKVSRYLKLSDDEIHLFLNRFKMFVDVVNSESNLDVIKNDPDDNRVLECAMAAKAHFIITGDQHLQEIREYQGIVILSPASFVAWLGNKSG